jgi:hypothetical protein
MDPKQVYAVLAGIYERSGKLEKADDVHEVRGIIALRTNSCCMLR